MATETSSLLAAVQNEVQFFFTVNCLLPQKLFFLISFLAVLFCGGPLYFACLA